MTSQTKLTVRYAETDRMGVAHHSNYAVWFEAGRSDFIRRTGISYTEMEAGGLMLPLYEIVCRFKKPARYEDELTVVTSLRELTRVRIILAYQVIRDSDGALLAEGETYHAITDGNLKPVNAERAAPDVFARLLKARE